MLYPKSQQPLAPADFARPGCEYRATPFWAWNCQLTEELLLEEIEQMKAMGFGGYHAHSRSGMATPYLSDEFMALIKACRDKAKREDMLLWLYDEDRWPSGAAGGLVTKDRRWRARYLLFTARPYTGEEEGTGDGSSQARGTRTGKGELLAAYDILLDGAGCLAEYRRIQPGDPVRGRAWYAYLEVSGDSPWYNNQAYLDTLNPRAVERFVQTTHERYRQAVGEDFGGRVPAIFTDEPQFSHKTVLGFAGEERDVVLPYTDDFPDTYRAAYGAAFLDTLPEVVWERADGAVLNRYRYHDHVAERFAAAFADTVGGWCEAHGLMLTGHMMEEPTLFSQTAALGEAMRSYRSFGLPGIDMLGDFREYTTAKQAQSASHQFGRPGVLSELYGVTGWGFDFRGHKLQGDWQAALGVTVRVPHLTWVSMGGEAKRDYPASIGYQSPWYREYPYVEDHFARVNSVLTRGKPAVRVGVIHPIESYWLHFGPVEQTGSLRQQLDERFQSLTQWLLFGCLDFDFICESLLPQQCGEQPGAPLQVGEMAYDAIVVPGCETLRSTTLRRLEAFRSAGGRVIFLGRPGSLVDAVPSEALAAFAARCEVLPFEKVALLEALDPLRDLEIRMEADGAPAAHLLYQLRREGEDRWLFVCHGTKPENPDVTPSERIRLRIRGHYVPTEYDTLTGEIRPCPYRQEGDITIVPRLFHAHDSLLLRLTPGTGALAGTEDEGWMQVEAGAQRGPLKVALSEPNALLLDTAAYAFDDGEWQGPEELLRVDNRFRQRLGYPLRMESLAQPWTLPPEEEPRHTLRLRFSVEAEVATSGVRLAAEGMERMTVTLNGAPVHLRPNGYYVDKAIQTAPLGNLRAGTNELEVALRFNERTPVEWMYLLGDFGVRLEGALRVLTAPVTRVACGDWARQGLPHYTGNLTYELPFQGSGKEMAVRVPHYRGGLLRLALDGKDLGPLAYAPYRIELGVVAPGPHTLDITCFGHRFNGFGAVHNADRAVWWHGPNAWRSTGDAWSDEYNLAEMGVLSTPRFEERG